MYSKGLVKILFLLSCLFGVANCASTHKNLPKEIPFAEDGIKLHLKADSMLNLYEDEPHTLVVCIYQLNDEKRFYELIKNEKGVANLLRCISFSDSVVSVQRVILHPGEIRDVTLNREKSTALLGLVAGYFESEPKKMTRMMKIPIQVYEEGFWFWKKRYRWPKELSVKLYLDPKGIRKAKEQKKNKEKKDDDWFGWPDKKAKISCNAVETEKAITIPARQAGEIC
jgi:type VI secretion system VasD/TssJ family lipoprotein